MTKIWAPISPRSCSRVTPHTESKYDDENAEMNLEHLIDAPSNHGTTVWTVTAKNTDYIIVVPVVAKNESQAKERFQHDYPRFTITQLGNTRRNTLFRKTETRQTNASIL